MMLILVGSKSQSVYFASNPQNSIPVPFQKNGNTQCCLFRVLIVFCCILINFYIFEIEKANYENYFYLHSIVDIRYSHLKYLKHFDLAYDKLLQDVLEQYYNKVQS